MFPPGQTFFGFFVQRLRLWCAAPFVADPEHYECAGHWPQAQSHGVANFDFFGRFDFYVIDAYPALIDLFGGEATGFVKARSPEPFIDSQFIHTSILPSGDQGQTHHAIKPCDHAMLHPVVECDGAAQYLHNFFADSQPQA